MREYDVVIGLEIHVQLKTDSKMFCTSSADYFGTSANSHVCPTCLGLPGALPVANKLAIENAIKVGLAINCKINLVNKFDRKSYFYPDLAKGYQISQFDQPINVDGWVLVGERKIRINRAHQEEDTGKLIHATVASEKVSLVDFNRSGIPLLEIVTEPDITSATEAKNYAKKIHQIMRYIKVADVDMEKAGMRFDANVSLRPKGASELGTKVEIKNINSFNFLEKAINYEIGRQKELLEKGEKIIQETRGWVENKGVTVGQRTKETLPDYRYFPDPDLPPLKIEESLVKRLQAELPELPDSKATRFKEMGLTDAEARVLVEDRETADWYEQALKDYISISKNSSETKENKTKKVANWVLGELLRFMNEKQTNIAEVKAEPATLAQLLDLIDNGEVSVQAAKQVFASVLASGELPSKIITDSGLKQISDHGELEKMIQETIDENPKALMDYKAGKENSFDFLFGQIMRKTRGSANPAVARELLKKLLN